MHLFPASKLWLLWLASLLPLAPAALRAGEAAERATYSAADQRAYEFYQQALQAAGLNEAPERFSDRVHFAFWIHQLKARLSSSDSKLERLQAVFEFLHREILTGSYRKDASDLQGAIHQGDYNCVSATILFVALCECCDLKPQIWAAPGHVLCRLPGPEPLDIETTCPAWLESGRRTAMPRQGLRQISQAQLVAKIYYNRGVLCLERQDFPAALTALRAACQLDPLDADARENLLAGLNNAALAECAAGRYSAGAALLAEARAIDPQYGPLRANDVHLHQRWVLKLCGEEQYAAALDLLEAGHARQPESPFFKNGRGAMYELMSAKKDPALTRRAGSR